MNTFYAIILLTSPLYAVWCLTKGDTVGAGIGALGVVAALVWFWMERREARRRGLTD